MIDYKLALKLKEAGFPLIDSVGYAFNEDKKVVPFKIDWTGDFNNNWIYIPTLTELIVACGKEFHNLENWKSSFNPKKDRWVVFSKSGKFGEEGNTPETAVANLWLKLNKKK